MNDPHIAIDREMFIETEHPIIGKWKINGNPVKLLDTKVAIRRPAPTLGQHNKDILGGILGMTSEDIALAEENGVI
jgi:formyl-CoA transferase